MLLLKSIYLKRVKQDLNILYADLCFSLVQENGMVTLFPFCGNCSAVVYSEYCVEKISINSLDLVAILLHHEYWCLPWCETRVWKLVLFLVYLLESHFFFPCEFLFSIKREREREKKKIKWETPYVFLSTLKVVWELNYIVFVSQLKIINHPKICYYWVWSRKDMDV